MSENIITLIKQVDLISGIYVHVLIEVIPGTDFNVVQTIRIFVTCYVQCFRIGVTDGWTQTEVELILQNSGFAPIFPDICYHLTHYKPAAADIPVASDNPSPYADAIRYNARTPLQGSLLPLTRLVWA